MAISSSNSEDTELDDVKIYDADAVDITPPVITVPANQSFQATFVLTPLDKTDYGTATATDRYPVIVTNNAPSKFPLGETTITWTAIDSNGNVSSDTQRITIIDTKPPTLILSPHRTFEATGLLTPLDDTDYGRSAASDIFPVEFSNNAPDKFPLGITTITYTATDSNGNVNTGAQLITLQDTTPPSITAPANERFEPTGFYKRLSELDYGTATGSDIFAPVKITNDAPDIFP